MGMVWVHLLPMLKLPEPPPPPALGKRFLFSLALELAGLYSMSLPIPGPSLKKKTPRSGYLCIKNHPTPQT